jgi:hypothetical protein
MDFITPLVAWLDWQSDRHPDVTALAAVMVGYRDVTHGEKLYWSADPFRTGVLLRACIRSGLVVEDYDVKDLRAAMETCDQPRAYFEVGWTLNRLKDRRCGVIP